MRRPALTVVLAVAAALAAAGAQAPDLARKSELAKSYMATGRFSEAAAVYAELVKAVPNNPGLLMNQGMALHLAGRDADAIPLLQSALKLDPSIPPALLFLGASFLRTNQPAEAIAPLKKFIALQPDHLEARQMIIDAANLAGRPAEAIPHLEKLAQAAPGRPILFYELGRAYENLAAENFAQLEKTHPESGPFFAILAETRSKTSQNRAAFFLYKKALAKTPNLRGLHASIADIYRRTGHADWAAAEVAAEAALPNPNCKAAAAPRTAECEFLAKRYRTALKAAGAGQTANAFYWRIRSAYQLAAEAFAKLAALPESPELHRYRAETHRDQKRYTEAVASWREALRLAPGNPDFQRELASALLSAKQYDDAQKTLDPLIAAEPGAPDLNSLQGDLLLAQQLPDRAIPFLEKAAALDPEYLPGRAQLARALLQAGRPADALPHVTAALPLDTDGSLHFQLARAYQSSGNAEAARTAMARYQELKAQSREQDRVLEEEVQITAPASMGGGK